MRPTQPFGQVLQIGRKLCRDLVVGIGFAHCLQIFLAALLRHLQAAAQVERQLRQSIWHNLGQDRRALAAAGDEHAENTIFVERWVIFVA